MVQLGYAVAVDLQHLQGVELVRAAVAASKVEREGGLPVGARGDEARGARAHPREHVAIEERTRRVPPAHQGGGGRHRDVHLLAKERDERLEVGVLPGAHVAAEQRLVGGPRGERAWLAPGRPPLDGGAGAVEHAVGRGKREAERPRGFFGREADHVAEEQDGALLGREHLERRHEREADALLEGAARLGARLGALEPGVGARLEPRGLGAGGRDGAARIEGGPALVGRARRGRTDVDRWLFWQAAHLGTAVDRIGFQMVVKGMMGMGGPDEAVVEAAKKDFYTCVGVLEGSLGTKEYVTGRLSIADFSLFSQFTIAALCGVGIDAYPAVKAWLGRMLARNSVKRALADAQAALAG